MTLETVGGENNWRLTIRRQDGGITVLRAVTCDEAAALPETLLGLPVTALGDHALSPTAGPAEGEAVLVTGGPTGPDPRWDNRRLRRLTLPPTLTRVGDYALLNCDGLESLRFWDDIVFWGGGSLMNCRSLHTLDLTRTGEQQESLAFFADELSRELDVTLRQGDGQVARLIFPEFIEAYEENCPAHHFDYNIYGAGYPYHHCFRLKKLSLKHYDALWRPYLGMEYDPAAAMRLAWYRLRYPLELTERAAADYWDYLRLRAADALLWRLREKDAPGLACLLAETEPTAAELTAACALARETGAAECLALLLEARHRKMHGAQGREFAL